MPSLLPLREKEEGASRRSPVSSVSPVDDENKT